MVSENYSIVAYIPGKLGEFVDSLRRRLNPNFAAWLAHVTLLPPRALLTPPEELLVPIRQRCRSVEPFVVSLGRVHTFWPANGVVYLSVSAGGARLAELHEALNCDHLACNENYPYVPHVTVAQELDEAGTHAALQAISSAWSDFPNSQSFRIESLVLVRQMDGSRWIDLATIPLGDSESHSR